MLTVKIIDNLFYFYYLLIILVIFLTWIPTINWGQQPLRFIREITEPYLFFFRRFIPPLGGLDLSPIVALIVLELLRNVFVSIALAIFQ